MTPRLALTGWLIAGCLGVFGGTLPAAEPAAQPAGIVVRDAASGNLDVDIDGWPLARVLERFAAVTGWEIHCPEGLSRTISAKFKNSPPGAAMTRLLGDLNYMALPTPGGLQLHIMDPSAKPGTTPTRVLSPPVSGQLIKPAPLVGAVQPRQPSTVSGNVSQAGLSKAAMDLNGDGVISKEEQKLFEKALKDSGLWPVKEPDSKPDKGQKIPNPFENNPRR